MMRNLSGVGELLLRCNVQGRRLDIQAADGENQVTIRHGDTQATVRRDELTRALQRIIDGTGQTGMFRSQFSIKGVYLDGARLRLNLRIGEGEMMELETSRPTVGRILAHLRTRA